MSPAHVIDGKVVPIHLWTDPASVEDKALGQLQNIASLPWVFHHVAVMPDVHYGIGATVGSVIAMKGAVSPAAVGVDLGCGMAAVRTSLKASDLPESLAHLRHQIERAVPVGFFSHKPDRMPVLATEHPLWDRFKELDHRVHKLEAKARQQTGTLGGGNHFIEICLDSGVCCNCNSAQGACQICVHEPVEPRVWIMLHSGSRGIGNELAKIHIERAQKLAHNAVLPDPELGVFLANTPEMAAYRRDLSWAQEYAFLNRQAMLELVQDVIMKEFRRDGLTVSFEQPITCHHNYLACETHFGEDDIYVTRKGAISARAGEMGIIPGSMGTRSYIVRGLGNPESFCSASHGAGRKMSRGEARRRFTKEDLAAQTSGVECRKDANVVDEIPGAYKSIEEVMANQADLVQITAELRQVLCVKG